MYITENPILADQIVRSAQARRESASPRQPGIHVSDLIYCLRKSWYRLQSGTGHEVADTADIATLTMFLTGHGHHALLENGRTEVEVKLHFGELGEVTGNIDYIPDDDPIPHEVKTTRASSNKPPDSWAHYVDQLGSYVLGWWLQNGGHPPEPDPLTWRGRLVVLFLNGNYADDRRAVLKVWDIEFTFNELQGWYHELQRRLKLLQALTPPSTDEHYKWECKYCPYGPQGDRRCPGDGGRLTPFFVNDQLPEWIEVRDASE